MAIAAFGVTCQPVVSWLVHATGNPMAPTWYLLVATAAGQVAMQLVPESAPVRLATRPFRGRPAGALVDRPTASLGDSR